MRERVIVCIIFSALCLSQSSFASTENDVDYDGEVNSSSAVPVEDAKSRKSDKPGYTGNSKKSKKSTKRKSDKVSDSQN